jgi:hypothetical protein
MIIMFFFTRCIARKAIGIELQISIVARHPEHINVSNGVVKLSNKER